MYGEDKGKKGALSRKSGEGKNPDYKGGTGDTRPRSEGAKKSSKDHPHVHIHTHESGHTMHVMHPDGTHEMHHMEHGDTAAMKQVLDEHLAGAGGAEQEPEAGGGGAAPGGAGPGGAEQEAA
jgi:hypothetical protein